jgi:DNA-directed RNA polymerase subunit RPC12/RpoP
VENEFKKLIEEKGLDEAVVVMCPYCGSQANKFRNYNERYMCIACKKKFWKSDVLAIKPPASGSDLK